MKFKRTTKGNTDHHNDEFKQIFFFFFRKLVKYVQNLQTNAMGDQITLF